MAGGASEPGRSAAEHGLSARSEPTEGFRWIRGHLDRSPRVLASSNVQEAFETSFFFFQSDYADEAYERVAWELGLVREQTFFVCTLRGRINGFDVAIRGKKNGAIEQIVVEASERIPNGLTLRPLSPAAPFRGLQTSDEGFDSRVFVMGPEAETIALLGHEARGAIMDVVSSCGGTVARGAVRIDDRAAARVLRGHISGEIDGKVLANLVRRMVFLAERLCFDDDIVARLAENVTSDERAGVRRKNLALLRTYYADDAQTRRAARAVLGHFDFDLRLDAAVFLADLDPADLRHVDAVYRARRASRAVRMTALVKMLARLEGDDRRRLLLDVLRSNDDDGRLRALRFCEDHRIDLGETTVSDLFDHRDPETVARICDLVKALGQSEFEAELVHTLRYQPSRVKCRAAAALGVVGGRDAVPALRRLLEGLVDAELRVVAQDALARIRSRLAHAPGGLSLARRDDTGAVSLTAEGGSLSLPAEGHD